MTNKPKKKCIFRRSAMTYLQERVLQDIFKDYAKIVNDAGYDLVFMKRVLDDKDCVNADCGWFKCSPITVTPEWLVKIVLNHNDDELRNAFRFTLGHELAHKERWCFPVALTRGGSTYIAQLNEVYADFGAAKIVADGNRDAMLRSIQYKKNEYLNKDDTKKDGSHPSWERRERYATYFDFGPELIIEIAKELGCHGTLVEKRMLKFYKGYDIKLN